MELSWVVKHHLVLVLALVMAESLAESINDDNLCHRVENYTETVREQYSEPVVVHTFTWCLSMPPRCRKTRTEMRIRYRVKSQLKQRNVTDCCPGFIKQPLPVGDLSGERCIPISNCQPGYIGNNCDIECPTGTWGIQCMQTCDCGAYATCNPINGSCNCLPGFRGIQCKDKCKSGTWGYNCANTCSCISKFAYCHHESGDCMLNNVEPIDEPPSSQMSNLSNDETLEVPSSSHPPVYPTETTSVNVIHSISITHTTSNTNDIIDHNDNETPIIKKINYSNATARNEVTSDTTLETTLINVPMNKYEYTNNKKLFVAKVENSTSIKPLVAVVHVSGKSISGHDNMIVTPIGNPDSLGNNGEKAIEHAPLPLDIVILIVIGSIISLGVTSLAVLAIFHVRSRLYETIRLAIYDAEKPDPRINMTLPHEKINDGRISTINRNSELLTSSCGYETPRCIVPERRDATLQRANSTITRESTYSNQYPNIQLFNNLQELLEAHYDRPPATSTFRQPTLEIDVEHLYDEIPLQSTTFASKTQDDSCEKRL